MPDRLPSRSWIVVTAAAGSAAAYAAMYAASRAMFETDAATDLAPAVTGYLIAAVALLALFAWVVSLAFRRLLDARAARLALAFAVVFQIGLAFGRPYLSIDVYSYIAQGHQAAIGESPYSHEARSLSDTVGQDLRGAGWLPVHGLSPYGPLWTLVERGVARTGAAVPAQAAMLKIIVVAFSLADVALIWLILGTLWPEHRLAGTLLFAWNPVVVLQLAGEGHNDAVMLALVLLSLLLAVRAKPTASIVAIAAAALFKITALVLAPLEVVCFWRTAHRKAQLVGAMAAAGAIAVALAAAAYAPFWIGPATFAGIRQHAAPSIMPSTPGVLYWYLTRTHGEIASARLVSFLSTASFAFAVLVAAVIVGDRTTLVRASGWLAAFYMLVAPGYWPWYAITPIALFALAPSESAIAAAVAISIGSLFAAPIDMLRVDHVMDWEAEMFATTLLALWAPALFIAARAAAVFVRGASLAWPRDGRRRAAHAATRGSR